MDLSVIIPCFNRAHTIRQAALSVLEQREAVDNLEVIVVDDGSTDDSLFMLNGMNIRVIETGGRRGACFARNLGVSESKYDWISFNDSDDIWLPSRMKLVRAMLEREGSDWFVHRFVRLYPSGKIVARPHISGSQSSLMSKILRKNFASTQCMTVRKEVFEGIGGFDVTLPRFQDWDFAIRLLSSCKVSYSNAILTACFEQEDSISKQYNSGLYSRKILLEKYSGAYSKHPVSRMMAVHGLYIRKLVGPALRK